MRRILAVCMALAFTLSLAGAALAQGNTSPGSSAPPASSTDTTKSTAPSGSGSSATDTTKPTAPSGSASGKSTTDKSAIGAKAGAAKMAGGARGQHKMMGEVTKLDASKGMLTLKTDEGDMDLHFPPSALQGIKEGDRVEVQLAIRPASGSPAGAKAGAGKTSGAMNDASKAGGAAKSGAGSQPKTQ